MKRLKTLGTLLFTAVLLAALSGCEKEGPAEQAGKEVDKAMQEAGEQLEQAGEDIQEATRDDDN
jgi:fructoselysine-6-P-deglycase FrlB-like protein